jgi:hypothetical protein
MTQRKNIVQTVAIFTHCRGLAAKNYKDTTMPEKILWGTKKGAPDYMEQIISTNDKVFDTARKWALENGFDRLRIAEIDNNPPDFTKTMTI